jgi:hypothetical protein
MRGCVLHGRFRFAQDDPGTVRKPVKAAPVAPPGPKRRPSV